jgi:hypothetical protein
LRFGTIPYEASAERGFFRALKEFRLVEKQPKAIEPAQQVEINRRELGSFLDLSKRDTKSPELALPSLKIPFNPAFLPPQAGSRGSVDVPFSIGRTLSTA